MLVCEGLMPFLMPQAWKRAMQHLSQLPDAQLRQGAVVLMGLGLLVLMLVDF